MTNQSMYNMNNFTGAYTNASAYSCDKNNNITILMRTVFAVGIFVALTVLALSVNVVIINVIISLAIILGLIIISLIIGIDKTPLKAAMTSVT